VRCRLELVHFPPGIRDRVDRRPCVGCDDRRSDPPELNLVPRIEVRKAPVVHVLGGCPGNIGITRIDTTVAVIVHEAPRTCGFGAELSATISEKALLKLQSPVVRVTGLDTPFPYTLEEEYLPNERRIRKALIDSLSF